jgi:hypothetical protein
MGALSKWFVHAIEARSGKERWGAARVVRKASESAEKEIKTPLQKIARLLEKRTPQSGRFGPEIHFVVVDNAAYYREKPVWQTHTPQAVALARELNKIGNPRGVFIHYATPNELRSLEPKNGKENPFFHAYSERGRRPVLKMSPAEASNAAYSYIRALHGKTGGQKKAFLLRMDDDVFPPMAGEYGRKPVRGNPRKAHANFFLDLGRRREGPSSGYGFSGPFRMEGLHFETFAIRREDMSRQKYAPNTYGSDTMFIGAYGGPSVTEAIFPPRLIHAGGKSLVDEGYHKIYPEHPGRVHTKESLVPVAMPPSRFFKSVLRNSGVNLPGAKRKNRAGEIPRRR